MLCISCYSILREAQNLLATCYEFQTCLQYNTDEILFFIREIENCLPNIITARVLKLNHRMFHTFVTSIFTYFIAAVQLEKSYNNKTFITNRQDLVVN